MGTKPESHLTCVPVLQVGDGRGWPKFVLQALTSHVFLLWPDFSAHGQTQVDKWFHRLWFKSRVSVRKTVLGARSTLTLEAPRPLQETWWAIENVGSQLLKHASSWVSPGALTAQMKDVLSMKGTEPHRRMSQVKLPSRYFEKWC